MRRKILLGLLLVCLVLGTPPSYAIPNPSAEYCQGLGYEGIIEETEEGQVGICKFPDGSSCSAWDFLQGECGEDWSYCKQRGYEMKTISIDVWSSNAICVLPDGSEAEVLDLMRCEMAGGKWEDEECKCPRDCTYLWYKCWIKTPIEACLELGGVSTQSSMVGPVGCNFLCLRDEEDITDLAREKAELLVTTPTVEEYIYAKNLENENLEKAALIKTEILPSTEEEYIDLVVEIHPIEPEVTLITEFWWQIPHQSRDISKPIECAVGEIKIGYEEDVSILTSQSSVLYCYPDEGKQHLVKDAKEEGNIELTRSVVKEVIGYLAGIPGVGIIIDEIFKWIKGSPIDISNSPQDQYLTDINEYDQYTMVWSSQDSKELDDESGIRYPNYVRINIPLRVDELNHQNEIHTYVKLLLEKRGKEFGVESDIIGERCLSSTEFSITMES
jgi:putative hemolysin